MENENEESLEAVEDGKYVGHGNGVLVYIQDTEHPGQAQENHQDCCPFHPGPATDPNLSGTLVIICFMFRTAFYLCQLWGSHSVIRCSVLLTKERDHCVTYGICRVVRALSSVIEVHWLVPELESRLERIECSKSETTNHHRKIKKKPRELLCFFTENTAIRQRC